MPKYDYSCPACGWLEEVFTTGEAVCCPTCGAEAKRLPHYASLTFRVPLNFWTDTRDVLGDPATVKEQVRRGEIIPAGKGSRWV